MDNGEFGRKDTRALEQGISSNIQKISQNVSSMSKMVNQLETAQDSSQLHNELKHIQTYTQQLARDTSPMLKELMQGPASSANKLARDRLRDEYMTTLNAFQKTQRIVAQKTKADVMNMKTKTQSVRIKDPFGAHDGDSAQYTNDNYLRQQEQVTMQKERELEELEERERDIKQLEKDILDVNQIFKELGTMIHQQGEFVDSIELNVENTAENVQSGREELRQAVQQKNKLRKRKMIIGVVIVIVICIIGIALLSK